MQITTPPAALIRKPPTVLYYDYYAEDLGTIRVSGITARGARVTHLMEVGERRGHTFTCQFIQLTATASGCKHTLVVDAARMDKAGFQFWDMGDGVWLCRHVPVQYIDHLHA